MATTVGLRVTKINASLGQGTSVGHLTQEQWNWSTWPGSNAEVGVLCHCWYSTLHLNHQLTLLICSCCMRAGVSDGYV